MAIETVDFNVNGACQLNCGFCWGPDHGAEESVTLEQWQQIASQFKEAGTKHIVFTGGEPLLKKNLHILACFVHEDLGMRTTLSTNGILIPEKGPDLLGYFDEVGIPIDGPTPATNQKMRLGSRDHLESALFALYAIQRNEPMIDLTIRTVVSRLNKNLVPAIMTRIVRDNFIDRQWLRWKLYQYQPIGPRIDPATVKRFWLPDNEFMEVVETVKTLHPRVNIAHQLVSDSDGRYLHIQPDGQAVAIKSLTPGTLPQEVPLGNVLEDFPGVCARVEGLLDKNHLHGQFVSNFVTGR